MSSPNHSSANLGIEFEHQDKICVLRLRGRFAAGDDPEYVLAKLEEVKTHACRRLLVDLRETASIGSLGLGLLVGLYTSVMKSGDGRFVLAGANERVREVLSLTRLDTIIMQAADLESGLSLLRGESSPARAN